MITGQEIYKLVQAKMPEATVDVRDLTGTQDHYEVRAMWSGFAGKTLIEQHQYINEALADPLGDGRIHALTIKTMAPAEAEG